MSHACPHPHGHSLCLGCQESHGKLAPVPMAREPTWFAIRPGVHDDKLWPQLADTPPLEDGHEPAQVLQVECVAWASHLWVILRALHGAVQALVAGWGVADKVSHVVRVWNGGLKAVEKKGRVWLTGDSDRTLPGGPTGVNYMAWNGD